MQFTDFEIGDLVISREKNSCDVRFVEDVNENEILLVNGIIDTCYQKQSIKQFNKDFRLFVKKKDTIEERCRLYSLMPQISNEKEYLCHNTVINEWYMTDDTSNTKANKTIFTETEMRNIIQTGLLKEPVN